MQEAQISLRVQVPKHYILKSRITIANMDTPNILDLGTLDPWGFFVWQVGKGLDLAVNDEAPRIQLGSAGLMLPSLKASGT